MRSFLLSVAVTALAAGLSGCFAKRVKPAAPAASSPRGAEPSIRGAEFASAIGVDDVLFDYDSSRLSETTRATLKRNAEILKENSGWQVLVEGYCDDRGTVEYNLALGQRRAKEVRDYYMMLGVPGDRIATISYGKERPVCQETTADCRRLNRRAEHKVRIELSADAKAR